VRYDEAVARRLWKKWVEAETEGMGFYCLKCVNVEIFAASKISILILRVILLVT